MQQRWEIENPKRRPSAVADRDAWFPYYAGFSNEFARKLLGSCGLAHQSLILDPWNGSGTSTAVAAQFGHRAIGVDINPVMVVVAKARMLPGIEMPSVLPLLTEIVKKATSLPSKDIDNDPLLTWFAPSSTTAIRSIEQAIRTLLIDPDSTQSSVNAVSRISAISAFFYVGLFRTVRQLLARFRASNPTWITRPKSQRSRIRPNLDQIREMFRHQITSMAASTNNQYCEWYPTNAECTIQVGSSESLFFESDTIDFVLSSPPYCTRIDYGVATLPELAVLGLEMEHQLRDLRATMIGTPTICGVSIEPDIKWGQTCNSFLERVSEHPSKAAKSYYYKTFIQYFSSVSKSMAEIARCLKPSGSCVIVVQDSYFKGIRADLAKVFTEIALEQKLGIFQRNDFPLARTFASVNTGSRAYRSDMTLTESVLCFTKN